MQGVLGVYMYIHVNIQKQKKKKGGGGMENSCLPVSHTFYFEKKHKAVHPAKYCHLYCDYCIM